MIYEDALSTLAKVAIAVLLNKVVSLGLVWPYLAVLVWIMTEAGVSFARLVLVPIDSGTSGHES